MCVGFYGGNLYCRWDYWEKYWWRRVVMILDGIIFLYILSLWGKIIVKLVVNLFIRYNVLGKSRLNLIKNDLFRKEFENFVL